MADRFQNGLLLTAATAAQVGRTFQRWLVEFATQICGMTLFDSFSSGSGSYTNTQATGINGAAVTAQPQQLDITGDAYTFTAADIGRYLTITGMPAAFADRNGIYRIVSVVSSKIVELDIRFSVHDAGLPFPAPGLSWRLWGAEATDVPSDNALNNAVLQGTGTQGGAYPFHCLIQHQLSDSRYPRFQISPDATNFPWVVGTPGNWTAGGNQTALFDNWNNNSNDACRVWAAGDSDRLIIGIREFDTSLIWNMLYIGEIDAFYSNAIDPEPVLVWHGSNLTTDREDIFGTGSAGIGQFNNGGRGLAADTLTTLTYYANFFQVSPGTGNFGWTQGVQRRWSARTRRIYRQAFMVESRTVGNMELRGSLRRTWLGGRNLLRGTPFGRNSEYLHIVGGLILPWNGSGVHEQRV